ncbi:sel1 repeat family protein [Rhodoblastus acidophilus]|uniref:Sel1 repeat family protein n=1 Tax=Candidatus Rhodoblastus alkanivorans TaxID=2954117 RepID=A0ABS9ZBB6_9HYPH|nr:tetratricopeptide repeat protein [Candidatus Rhodoblastus alkanivorans]MCI4679398.1 sel1 repeat family protein [Candidatus Rhodoblastus alkanivorans]MCI4684874.1 sel1 repeat family protein [Candidatus Rhodoblastus alkanivorans]MDI4642198.1 sel1 repeat family protein [Rhodoblastus acidophilus]
MIARWRYAHFLLWHGDAAYRRIWFIAPQLLALAGVSWLLIETPKPSGSPPDWGKPALPTPERESARPTPAGAAADALRDRAKTDPAALAEIKAKAADGDAVMQFELATLYDPTLPITPHPLAPNAEMAKSLYLTSAKQGLVASEFNYGNFLAYGLAGTAADPETGLQWVVKAAKAGDLNAQRVAGNLYWNGIGAPKNKELALEWYRKAADRGDHYSIMMVGEAYWVGIPPFAKDHVESVKWFRKIASNPAFPAVARYVAVAYRDGDGVQKDHEEAVKWFRKAAEEGDHFAQREIADYYWAGTPPFEKDRVEAVKWYLKASVDPAYPLVWRTLGVAYRNGDGAPRDPQEAIKWFTKAAEAGDPFSAAELGIGYFLGNPPYARDDGEATKWLAIGAKSKTESLAQRLLGICYLEGRGVNRDPKLADFWLKQARANGDKEAGKLLRTLR